MENKAHSTVVIKIGGSTLGQNDTTIEDIVTLQRKGYSLIVVHGGGKVITDWLSRQGVATKFVRGERVTDKVGLEVTAAVLAGLVNKELVASINSLGGSAFGISGVDGSLLQGKIKDSELGFVGLVGKVDIAPLVALLRSGYLPVVSSLSLNMMSRIMHEPLLLNVNADTVAGDIAAAMGADKLVFLTDVPGISDKSGKLLASLSGSEAESLIAAGVASGGMIPKIRAGIKALSSASTCSIIDGRQPHALLKEMAGEINGTVIRR